MGVSSGSQAYHQIPQLGVVLSRTSSSASATHPLHSLWFEVFFFFLGWSWTLLNIGISRTIGGSVLAPLATCIPEGQSQQAGREEGWAQGSRLFMSRRAVTAVSINSLTQTMRVTQHTASHSQVPLSDPRSDQQPEVVYWRPAEPNYFDFVPQFACCSLCCRLWLSWAAASNILTTVSGKS